jgi:hypothetical protein
MVEVTETQGKDIVCAMKKMSGTKERKVTVQGDIAVKQLEYFRQRDHEISRNQQGLVDAIGGLSYIIAQAYAARTQQRMPSRPPSPVPQYEHMEVDNEPVHVAHEGDGGQILNAAKDILSPTETSVQDNGCCANMEPCIENAGPSGPNVNIAGSDLL